MKTFFINNFFKFLLFLLCFFILSKASICGQIFPFASGLALALIWRGQKLLPVASAYAIASLLSALNLSNIIGTGFLVFFIIIVCSTHTKLKKPITFPLFIFYTLFSHAGFVGAEFLLSRPFIWPLLSAIASTLFMWGCKGFLPKVLGSSASTSTHSLGALILLTALSAGLASLEVFSVPLILIFAPICILVSAATKTLAPPLITAIALGLGAGLETLTPSLLAPFTILALTSFITSHAPRPISAISVAAISALLGYCVGLFPAFSSTQLITISISCLAFCILPEDFHQKIISTFSPTTPTFLNSIVTLSNNIIQNKLSGLSEVFAEMDYIFRTMVKGGLSAAETKSFLAKETTSAICADCPKKNVCHRKSGTEISAILEKLVASALARGKITLLDAPAFLTTHCIRVAPIVDAVNTLSANYKRYSNAISSIDSSRLLMADELRGISQILKTMSTETISSGTAQEEKILSALLLADIPALQVFVETSSIQTTAVTLLLPKPATGLDKIARVVSSCTRQNLEIASISPFEDDRFEIVTLKTAVRFCTAFGTASIPKNAYKPSGDAYSVLKIAHGKYLLAICDGMGTGETAQKTSSTAISLVENFYKAGFDNEIILSSINKLLSLQSQDNFSALDICVFNAFDGTADFIKMGAPESIIKTPSTTKKIQAPALPLGIVASATPASIQELTDKGSFVYMFSDGISESFETASALESFIASQTAVNPQILAEELLQKALSNCAGNAQDDMTVIVCKIY